VTAQPIRVSEAFIWERPVRFLKRPDKTPIAYQLFWI